MRTYLLEKSRVVFQSEEERNYHIFYQLCASRNSHAEVSELYLDACESFHYTNQGRTNLVIPGVSDEKLFLETVEALTLLGFGLDDRRNFFKLLAAILHLGNVRIQKSDQKAHGVDSSCSIPKDDVHLEHFCNLLQVDFDALRKWLTCRKIVTGKEEFLKPMSPQDAINCRDALSKLLYAEAFAWVVAGVNRSLQCSGNTQRFIGNFKIIIFYCKLILFVHKSILFCMQVFWIFTVSRRSRSTVSSSSASTTRTRSCSSSSTSMCSSWSRRSTSEKRFPGHLSSFMTTSRVSI